MPELEAPDNIPWNDERGDPVGSVEPGNYSRYGQTHEYDYDPGLAVFPLASRDPHLRVIRLHGGFQTRKMDWEACRQGKPPVIPAAVDTAYDKLVGAVAVINLPVPTRDGGLNWSTRGTYTYVEAGPRIPGQHTLPTGHAPWWNSPTDSNAVSRMMDNIGAIEEGLQALADAGPDDTPVAPVEVVASFVSLNQPGGVDQPWPFTFLAPIFSSDTAVET